MSRILLLLLLLGVVGKSSSLTCYYCYNCLVFEPASQAKACSPLETKCIKIDLPTGNVNRLCATEETCDKGTGDKNSADMSCCSTDNCNFAPRANIPIALLFLLVVLPYS
ncbi:uncharacterized protein LOC111697089 [Eurytemora carolleeae]|uniref:uncharacterized protein LOC111697089 n=1 Tax=Eurytemora carolleeae TaxID=1294199 RepID=UPI000C77835F|nr:uncharacterized protein LOC111697089 [Eurytemora carolleeae]|eukprot:XP_023322735.1 uncharacterized protein LOC111697089 [Eurytemora affinis]